jgi:hypothetical protein
MLWSKFSLIFVNFQRKKMAFFLNTNVMFNFFQNLALFRVKNANFFEKFFGKKIFFNQNIGPKDRRYDFKNIFADKIPFLT